jgi:hypothetical protein
MGDKFTIDEESTIPSTPDSLQHKELDVSKCPPKCYFCKSLISKGYLWRNQMLCKDCYDFYSMLDPVECLLDHVP